MATLHDSIRSDAPAVQTELEYLRGLQVGDTRRSVLVPALDLALDWVCRGVTKDQWEFDVKLFDTLLYTATVTLTEAALTCDLKEVA